MKPTRIVIRAIIIFFVGTVMLMGTGGRAESTAIDLGTRRELFVDSFLIERMAGVRLAMQKPEPREIAFRFDEAWEHPFAGAATVIKDGPLYRIYYRGMALNQAGNYNPQDAVTCCAESTDGVTWTKPKFGLFESHGSTANNIVLRAEDTLACVNFQPMLDARPGVPATEHYKAIGGTKKQGLFRYVSADGIHWRRYSAPPLFAGYALDTLNVLIWSPAEQCYAIYLRTWTEGGTPDKPTFAGHRTISRSTSRDFVNWSTPEPMSFGDAPVEDIYTNGTQPYFRASHILVALPFRFWPERRKLSDETMNALGVHSTQREGISDAILMTSRGGRHFDRTFMESFIRPGPEDGAWVARSNVPLAGGPVPAGKREMSLYLQQNHTTHDYCIRRFTLQLDRFASVNAPYAGGELVTKPFTFRGNRLTLNYATSAAGSIAVELQDETGRPLQGFAAADCTPLIGDDLSAEVRWRGGSLRQINGQIVRLRFLMKDADLFALQFLD